MRILDHRFEPDTTAFQRVEVITGTGRRRRWSVDDKARNIEETLRPGAVASEIARRYEVSPQQIFGWRREARRRTTNPVTEPPSFAPVLLEAPAALEPRAGAGVIEIVIGDVVVRVRSGVDSATLAMVMAALKAAS